MGWINEKTLSKQIYEVVSKLDIGEISKPIKGQNSILFLKLNKIRVLNSDEIDKEELKKKLLRKREMIFLIYIPKVDCLN